MAFKSRKLSCVCYLPTLILTNLHNKYIFNEIRLRSRSRGLEMSLVYLKPTQISLQHLKELKLSHGSGIHYIFILWTDVWCFVKSFRVVQNMFMLILHAHEDEDSALSSCAIAKFEVCQKIHKFGLQLWCSMGAIFSFSSFKSWVQFQPFVQSNQLDVQCMVIAKKERATFPFNP